jgi:hypothetical protein
MFDRTDNVASSSQALDSQQTPIQFLEVHSFMRAIVVFIWMARPRESYFNGDYPVKHIGSNGYE